MTTSRQDEQYVLRLLRVLDDKNAKLKRYESEVKSLSDQVQTLTKEFETALTLQPKRTSISKSNVVQVISNNVQNQSQPPPAHSQRHVERLQRQLRERELELLERTKEVNQLYKRLENTELAELHRSVMQGEAVPAQEFKDPRLQDIAAAFRKVNQSSSIDPDLASLKSVLNDKHEMIQTLLQANKTESRPQSRQGVQWYEQQLQKHREKEHALLKVISDLKESRR
jgi:hypothetical protein